MRRLREDAIRIDPDDLLFLDLVRDLPPGSRRMVSALLRRVAVVEAAQGETAALSLIENISSILARPEVTH